MNSVFSVISQVVYYCHVLLFWNSKFTDTGISFWLKDLIIWIDRVNCLFYFIYTYFSDYQLPLRQIDKMFLYILFKTDEDACVFPIEIHKFSWKSTFFLIKTFMFEKKTWNKRHGKIRINKNSSLFNNLFNSVVLYTNRSIRIQNKYILTKI